MKILFLCHGHFDSGLELFNKLNKIVDSMLVVQVEGDKLIQSVLNVDISDISLGVYLGGKSKFRLVNEIEKLFEIPAQKICVLKYRSLSLRDRKNFSISKEFSAWVKKEGFTHIHYYGSSLTWVQQLLFLRDIKRIYTVHDYLPHSGEVRGSGYQYKFYMKVITSLKTHRFLLLSNKMMNEFIEYYKVPKDNCRYILFGPFNCYKKFEKLETKEEAFTILYFGRISAYKGIEYLVEATKIVSKEIPQIKTIIAGSGEFYFDISDIRDDNRFEIHNYYINNQQLADYIRRCSIVVCPYTDATQSGVVMTAYAFNKPVIVTDVGSFREYIIEGETGLIVPPRNAEALAEAIKKLLNNSTLFKYMEERIIQIKDKEFSWKETANKLVKIYDELI